MAPHTSRVPTRVRPLAMPSPRHNAPDWSCPHPKQALHAAHRECYGRNKRTQLKTGRAPEGSSCSAPATCRGAPRPDGQSESVMPPAQEAHPTPWMCHPASNGTRVIPATWQTRAPSHTHAAAERHCRRGASSRSTRRAARTHARAQPPAFLPARAHTSTGGGVDGGQHEAAPTPPHECRAGAGSVQRRRQSSA